MSRSAQLAIAMLCGGVFCISCAKDSPAVVERQELPVTFSVVQKGMNTRALFSGTTFPEDQSFGAFAYLLEPGKNWRDNKSDASPYIQNAEVAHYDDAEGVFAADSWHTSDTYYWPRGGNTLTFLSYAPYTVLKDRISCTPAAGLALSGWTAAMTPGDADLEGVDIMLATAENQTIAGIGTSGTHHAGVPTAFQHICCQVEVLARLDNADASADYTINTVTFTNLWSTADYSSYGWGAHKDLKDVSYTSNMKLNKDGKTSSSVFPAMIVIPQNLLVSTGSDGTLREAPGIKVEFTTGTGTDARTTSFEKKFVDVNGLVQAWEKGKKYVLTIAFSTEDAYIEFGTSVGDWNSESNADIIIGQ